MLLLLRRRPAAVLAAVAVGAGLLVGIAAPPAFAATRTWDGSASYDWSNPANWAENAAPVDGDILVFPPGVANQQSNNDIAGLRLIAISIQGAGYNLSGNGVELTSLDVFAAGTTVFQMGNGGPGIIVPAGGTFTETIGAGADVQQDTQYDIGDGTVDFDVSGTLVTNHLFTDVQAGAGVIRRGSGEVRITQGADPRVPWDVQSGTTFFDNNGQNGAVITQTGGIVGGASASIHDLTVNGGSLSPGNTTFTTGTITVSGNLTVAAGGEYLVDVRGRAQVDSVSVQDDGTTGAPEGVVTLAGALTMKPTPFIPVAGQSFTIIDNDGADAVVGTFDGLSEGSPVSVNGVATTISYAGGDGNDVVLSMPPAAVWDGDASPGDPNWTTAANWVGDVVPAAGDTLEFPDTPNRVNDNDFLPSTSFGGIVLSGSGYVLDGNRVDLDGGVTVTASGANSLNLDVELTGGGFVQLPDPGTSLFVAGDLSVDGGDLSVTGTSLFVVSTGSLVNDLDGTEPTGTVTLPGPMDNLFLLAGSTSSIAGPVTINSDSLVGADGTLTDAGVNINGGALSGVGSVDGITAPGGFVFPGGQSLPGVLTSTADVALAPGAVFQVDVDGPTAGTGHDQLAITGAVDVTGASLSAITSPPNLPPVGVTMVIVDNDGADAVTGTFDGLPEGATVMVSGIPLRISYVGGDGNDITLSVPNVSTWTGATSNAWNTASNWQANAVPTAGATLVFPDGASNIVTNNNLAVGTTFHDILFTGSAGGYELNGNGITLDGDVISSSTLGTTNKISFPVTTIGDTSITADDSVGTVWLATTIDPSGPATTITLAGAGDKRVDDVLDGAIDVTGGFGFLGSMAGLDKLSVTNAVAVLDGTSSMADVDVGTGGALAGAGAFGELDVTGDGVVTPGLVAQFGILTSSGDVNLPAGTTFAVGINGTTAGTDFDQLVVTGGDVNVGGFLSVGSQAPPPLGQTVRIIDNQGANPVNGNFVDRPEGTVFQVNGGFDAVITYQGGDGNDVEVTFPPTFTWDGGGGDDDWTTGANWVGDSAPTGNDGERLVFPDGVSQFTTDNDFGAGTAFYSIRVTGGAYTFNGDAVALDDGVVVYSLASLLSNLDITLTGGGNVESGGSATFTSAGTIDADGATATFTGSGDHVLDGPVVGGTLEKDGAGTLTLRSNQTTTSGPIFVSGGTLDVQTDTGAAGVDVSPGALAGDGDVEGIAINGGGDFLPGGMGSTAIFTSDAGYSQVAGAELYIDLDTTTPGTGHDQVAVTGTVLLGGDLVVNLVSPTVPGASYTIIDNDGADAVTGTFAGLPGGATFTAGGRLFRIDYDGGDGNDVVLTEDPTFVWTGGGVDPNWMTGGNWVGGVAPSGNAGENLVFPPGALDFGPVNDFPAGTGFGDLRLTGQGYTVQGAAFVLDGDVTDTSGSGSNRLWLSVTFTGGGAIVVDGDGSLALTGTLTVPAGSLVLDGTGFLLIGGPVQGAGDLVKDGLGLTIISAAFTALAGPITVNAGELTVNSDVGPAALVGAGGILNGYGRADGVTTTGAVFQPGSQGAPGVFTSDAGVDVQGIVGIDVLGPGGPEVGHDQIAVTGTVTLGGGLALNAASGLPAGSQYVIVANDGADPVVGTFLGLPQGAAVGGGLYITYTGGDGNDVVLFTPPPVPPSGIGGSSTSTTSTPSPTSTTEAPPAERRDCAGDFGPPSAPDVDPESVHAAAIACLEALGIFEGLANGTFDPTGTARRGQMAAVLVRMILVAGFDLPDDAPDAFGDDDGSVFEDAIDLLAELGIIRGKQPGVFDPGAPLTRGQAAALLRRVIEALTGEALPDGPDAFEDDDGDPHEADINALAAIGVIRGTGPGTFGPNDQLRRDQLATLIARELGVV